MQTTQISRLLQLVGMAGQATSTDLTLRQLSAFLVIALGSPEGIDAFTVEKRTGSSQAATSRVLKLLAVEYGLTEMFLDPMDGRRRLARLTPKGERLIRHLTQ